MSNNEDLVLVNYYEDFGRSGILEGMFICTKGELESLNGEYIVFGEVLGKHSDVYSDEVYQHCKIKETTKTEMDMLVKLFGVGSISGYYPFDYIEE